MTNRTETGELHKAEKTETGELHKAEKTETGELHKAEKTETGELHKAEKTETGELHKAEKTETGELHMTEKTGTGELYRTAKEETEELHRTAKIENEKWLKEALNCAMDGSEHRLNQMLAPKLQSCCYEDQTITMRYDLEDWQMNPRGELHGGAIAAMLDLSLGVAARCASQTPQVATADLSISYLRRVDGDDAVTIQTKIQKRGRLMIRITGEARSIKTGKMVAVAQCAYVVLQA